MEIALFVNQLDESVIRKRGCERHDLGKEIIKNAGEYRRFFIDDGRGNGLVDPVAVSENQRMLFIRQRENFIL
jgi:hypothetical protein